MLHINYAGAGPFLGKMFLVTVDVYLKWLEVLVVNVAISHVTIECLPTLFATHGIPKVIISDNRTQLTSAEFS